MTVKRIGILSRPQAKVLHYIAENPDQLAYEISKYVRTSKNDLYPALRKLNERKLISYREDGLSHAGQIQKRYQVTPLGVLLASRYIVIKSYRELGRVEMEKFIDQIDSLLSKNRKVMPETLAILNKANLNDRQNFLLAFELYLVRMSTDWDFFEDGFITEKMIIDFLARKIANTASKELVWKKQSVSEVSINDMDNYRLAILLKPYITRIIQDIIENAEDEIKRYIMLSEEFNKGIQD
jgi:DNA-binding PadR family transcriptional regulator